MGGGTGRARRPGPAECAGYQRKYVDLVPDGDVTETLVAEGRGLADLLRSAPADRETFRYAEGKWTVREVVGHIVDTERVFAYRAAHVARGDPAPLPSMDQDLWAGLSNAGARPLADLAGEFEAVRASTVALFRGLDPAAWDRGGTAAGLSVTPRVLAWVMAGHARHHAGVLERAYGLRA